LHAVIKGSTPLCSTMSDSLKIVGVVVLFVLFIVGSFTIDFYWKKFIMKQAMKEVWTEQSK
jgi:hypothetical protein